MTNKELAEKYSGCSKCACREECLIYPKGRCSEYNHIMDVTKVKDLQFQEKIDKACEWLDYHLLDYHLGEQQVSKVIEDFRKAMED